MVNRNPAPTVPASDALTIIGEGITVNGRIDGEEDLRVEGRVEGSIALTETVHVAESGVVVATIEARDVIVSGVVVGNVSASNSVSLDPGAKLVGDISAPRVIIADGAAFRGNVAMAEGVTPAIRARTATASGSSRAATTPRSRPASGSSRVATPAAAAPARPAARPIATRPAARSTTASRTSERTSERSGERSASPRVAAIRPPTGASSNEEEVTVVVRHSALADGETATETKVNKKKSKKSPPRGRVPKRGKRGVNRR